MKEKNNELKEVTNTIIDTMDNNSEIVKTKMQNLKRGEKTEDKRERKKTSGELPNNIRFYRKKYGYTQKKLQDEWDVNQQAISKYETGEKKTFKPEEIKKILDTFPHLTFDELFGMGRLSVCINQKNQKLLKDYLNGMRDVFPSNDTEYEKINVIVNHILKMFLDRNQPIELKSAMKDEPEFNK
jgi:DNA-binding XRE family transcriptional regulator